jgi:tellurite resistance protein
MVSAVSGVNITVKRFDNKMLYDVVVVAAAVVAVVAVIVIIEGGWFMTMEHDLGSLLRRE